MAKKFYYKSKGYETKEEMKAAKETPPPTDYAGKVTPTYQIGKRENLTQEEFNQAKGLIEARTPTGSKQLEDNKVKQVVEASNLQQAQAGKSTPQQINAILKNTETLPIDTTTGKPQEFTAGIPPLEQTQEQLKIKKGQEFQRRRQLLLNPSLKNIQEVTIGSLKESAGVVANAYDAITRLISPIFSGGRMRQSAVVTQATDTFSNVKSAIADDIATGNLDIAMKDYEEAVVAINRLESYTHTAGIIDLNRFLDNGLELETKIKEEKRALERIRLQINQAILKQQLGLI